MLKKAPRGGKRCIRLTLDSDPPTLAKPEHFFFARDRHLVGRPEMSSTGSQPARRDIRYLISSGSGAVRIPSPPADKSCMGPQEEGPHVIQSDHSISRVRPPRYITKTFFFPSEEKRRFLSPSLPFPGSPSPIVETLAPSRRRRWWQPQHRHTARRTTPRTLPPGSVAPRPTDRSSVR